MANAYAEMKIAEKNTRAAVAARDEIKSRLEIQGGLITFAETQMKQQKEKSGREKLALQKELERRHKKIDTQSKVIDREKDLAQEKGSRDAQRIKELEEEVKQLKAKKSEPAKSIADTNTGTSAGQGRGKGKADDKDGRKDAAKKEKSEKKSAKEAINNVSLQGLETALYDLEGDATSAKGGMAKVEAALDAVREAPKDW